jgi:hypothetical protein
MTRFNNAAPDTCAQAQQATSGIAAPLASFERATSQGRLQAVAAIMLVAAAITLLLTGCAFSPRSPFSTHYYDVTEGVDVSGSPIVEAPGGQPGLYRGTDLGQDAQAMVENGYALVGYSAFDAGSADDKGALSQAREVHASTVLVYGQYDDAGEINPFTPYDDQTSLAGIYRSAGHPGHPADSGSSGRATGVIYNPYSGRRVNYFASYWVKLKPPIFGTSLEHPGAGVQEKSGIDRGMLVKAVVDDSPAFLAGVRKGDILVRIGVVDINSDKAFDDALKIYEGEAVDVVLNRDGSELEKRVRMPFAQ